MKYDYLIVGSGLFGATFANLAKKDGKKVLVIEKRPNIAGNIYTEEIEGIQVHRYGAHIFHTDYKDVWNYVNSFIEFNRYTNSPVAKIENEIYNMPFNMNTFSKIWDDVFTPDDALRHINEEKKEMKKNLKSAGFTLIELLAVITIMGILMMVAIPSVSRTIENSRRDTFANVAKQYINTVRDAVLADELTCDTGENAKSVGATPDGLYYYRIDTTAPGTKDLMESSANCFLNGQPTG